MIINISQEQINKARKHNISIVNVVIMDFLGVPESNYKNPSIVAANGLTYFFKAEHKIVSNENYGYFFKEDYEKLNDSIKIFENVETEKKDFIVFCLLDAKSYANNNGFYFYNKLQILGFYKPIRGHNIKYNIDIIDMEYMQNVYFIQ